ncbi:bifunctional diaminohydroxyphosphoribosylaminopyrimidine deaminase/5-amino-6-(5-phosphoribosylamino)uracil reductase RibD [Desulfonatronum thiodismutans]|uniref:bifunctional diaminohydroxyphosphoribosylaminopyrimidine deaminase/5-amino-6-(5-phosphoribosylamino)uracil reductase RibD n=1 Tax=Desulfonatronum thiodismutans TaxID=159290 RepID=UPI000AAEB95B|nr:bifunctional diaminohydroxyphosphoribosylaminopyrimidine deaminase/5-amino-6-(5-phosphoribosylamino)uracil reductase RibD [Desulfonatronum thiodismutans]
MNSFALPDDAGKIMLQAVALAEQGKGQTAPNPCVGAVLTQDGRIVARGHHRGPGLPHAEVEVLQDAAHQGIDPKECILWVTLEPCNHTGRTPPCTQAVVQAGIRRVVVGTADPNPRVIGGGIDHLRNNGVQVVVGVAEQACRDLIADFRTWIDSPLPYLYLKLACTLDGRIATRSGDSQWISNARSRQMVHTLRSRVGAVMVGAGTFRADDPRLTCRLSEADRPPDQLTDQSANPQTQPLAIVVGSKLPDSVSNFYLLRERPEETIFWTTETAAQNTTAERLRALGARVWGAGSGGQVDLKACLTRLRSELGVMDVLCEGGGRLAQHVITAGLVGEWWLFLATKTLGDARAVPLLSGAEVPSMADAWSWRTCRVRELDGDLMLVLRPESTPPHDNDASGGKDGCSPA